MIIDEAYIIYGYNSDIPALIGQTGRLGNHIKAIVMPFPSCGALMEGIPVISPEQIGDMRFDRIGIAPGFRSSFEQWNCNRQISQDRILDLAILVHRFKKSLPRHSFGFEVNLTEHCNLNCKYCLHFSPLAKPSYANPKKVEKDMTRLAELTGGKVDFVKLLGGEPLLHPQVPEFLKIARKWFPECERIRLNTNGLLLPIQKAEFWKTCAAEDIIIEITKYPAPIAYEKAIDLAEKYRVKYFFCGLDESGIKHMTRKRIDINGKLDGRESFMRCRRGAICNFLWDGFLYPCPAPVVVRHFATYFGLDISSGAGDGIDIHNIHNLNEIFRFLENPIPFCCHCDIAGMEDGLLWEPSERKINEWS